MIWLQSVIHVSNRYFSLILSMPTQLTFVFALVRLSVCHSSGLYSNNCLIAFSFLLLVSEKFILKLLCSNLCLSHVEMIQLATKPRLPTEHPRNLPSFFIFVKADVVGPHKCLFSDCFFFYFFFYISWSQFCPSFHWGFAIVYIFSL